MRSGEDLPSNLATAQGLLEEAADGGADIAVLPEHRRKGLAGVLMRQHCEILDEAGVLALLEKGLDLGAVGERLVQRVLVGADDRGILQAREAEHAEPPAAAPVHAPPQATASRNESAVAVNGVEGDRQRNRMVHGGPNRAVCLYSLELIEALRAEGHPIVPGSIGENLTLASFGAEPVRIGDRFRVGAAVVEVTDTSGDLWLRASHGNATVGTAHGGIEITADAARNVAPPLNTTLAVVATDAALTKAQAQKLAGTSHDGLARAVRPVHLLNDGDTVFALSTGTRSLAETDPLALNEVLAAGADMVTEAIVGALLAAESVETPGGTFPSYRDLYQQ